MDIGFGRLDQNIYFDPALFSIKDSLGNSYNPEDLYNSGLGGVGGHLNRGKGGFPVEGDRGKLLFRVPENMTDLKLQYHLNQYEPINEIISWSLE